MEAFLYADRRANYVLADAGPAWTPADLIARYNLELAWAALYWSDGLQVTIGDTYKDFWRYLKLFKLMFWATPSGDGYSITLDGPISPFVKSTTRYGRQLAAFLPAVFLCSQWQMEASVHPPQLDQGLVYRLDDTAPLTSHFKRSGAFDSRLEADFAAEFEGKFGGKRGQWQLTREDELLLLGDTVMIPDFALTHKRDGLAGARGDRRLLAPRVPAPQSRQGAGGAAAGSHPPGLRRGEPRQGEAAGCPGRGALFPEKARTKGCHGRRRACRRLALAQQQLRLAHITRVARTPSLTFTHKYRE